MHCASSKARNIRSGSLRQTLKRLLVIALFALPVQVGFTIAAKAEWKTVLNCVPGLHSAQVGLQTLSPNVQMTFPPPSVPVVCISLDDGSKFSDKAYDCPAAENKSISIRWQASKVYGRCNPITPPAPEEETTEESE